MIKTRFVKSWKRINCFAYNENDIRLLQDFQSKIQRLAARGFLLSDNPENKKTNLKRLEEVSRSWNNSIQFTEPRGSLNDPETLLNDIAKEFLLEPLSPEPPHFRDRKAAIKVTKKIIKSVVDDFGEDAKEYFKTDYKIRGEYSTNKCDVAVANGRVFLATQAISFEIKTNEHIRNSVSWLISDVKKINPSVPIGIVMLPPKRESKRFEESMQIYDACQSTYRSLGAETINESDLESWTYDRLGKEFATLVT